MLVFTGTGTESPSSTAGRPLDDGNIAVCGRIGGRSSGEVTEAAFAALAVASIAAVVGAGLGFAIGTTGAEEKWAKARNRAAC
jgi:hypothetical protein